ncbi:hypothetical protein PFISCL1PPCAC_1070 [Pristionchus fissidentatus]|uniref:Uncharacterized protein n=1 Tax=Pristionchus fissidentatus TaxID=1538716 RepID=A0AAV5UU80_9BILA|nr:hypothetical protein PFISCL1PPCAC_1070 [Pristionchus fissidentatus]
MFIKIMLATILLVTVNAQWSAWTEKTDSVCPETCGMCGVKVVATRTCTGVCSCSGPSQRYEECGSKMCLWPRKYVFSTCCAGYKKGVLPSRAFECVAIPTIAAKTRIA